MSAAAVLPLLLLAVAAIEIARVIATMRRAVRLNRALHELRRPLQSMSLSIEGRHPDLVCAHACLDQARGALDELDAVVNRRTLVRAPVRTAIAQIAEALEDRWRFAGVRVTAPAGGRELEADPVRLGAALDNLVANAVEHGDGPVSVRALSSAGAVRFEVREEGSAATASVRGPTEEPPTRSEAAADSATPSRKGARASDGDPRRGHGLAIAAVAAAEHGGTLIAPAALASGAVVAAISLPAPAENPAPR